MGEEFGKLLCTFRKRSVVGKISSGKTFTQPDLAANLLLVAKLKYSPAAISNWERGKNGISPLDRYAILGLVRTLVYTQGITELHEAKRLLQPDGHPPLTAEEIEEIKPSWLESEEVGPRLDQVMGGVVDASTVDSAELVGRTATIDTLLQALIDPTKPCVTLLTGISGSGKSALVRELCQVATRHNYFAQAEIVHVSNAVLQTGVAASEVVSLIAERVLAEAYDALISLDQLVPQVAAVLETQTTLLVFDGEISVETGNWLCDFLPTLSQKARYLLVLRSTLQRSDTQHFRLYPLNHGSAHRFAKRFAKARNWHDVASRLDAEQFAALYHAVGGTPAGLELVVSLLSSGMPLDDVLDSLLDAEETDSRIEALHQTFQALIEQLKETDLRLLSSFLFANRAGANRATLLAISGLNRRQWRKSYARLESVGLILYAEQTDWYATQNLTAYLLNSPLNPLHATGAFSTLAQRALAYWQQQLRDAHPRYKRLDTERFHWFRSVETMLLQPDLLSQQADSLLSLSQSLYRFVRRRGFWRHWLSILRRLVVLLDEEQVASAELTHVRSQLGVLLRKNDEPDQAARVLHQAAREARAQSEPEAIGSMLYYQAGLRSDIGDWDEAVALANEALAQFEQAKEQVGIAACATRLGEIAYDRGDSNSAETHFKQAIALLDRLQDRRERIRAYHNLGLVYRQQELPDNALDAFDAAAALLAHSEDDIRLPNHNALLRAETHIDLGDLEEAAALLESIDTELLDARAEGDLLARTHRAEARLHLATGKLDAALACIERSERLWRRNQPRQQARTLYVKMKILQARHNKKAAQQACQTALSLVLTHQQYADMQRLHMQLLEEQANL